MVVLFLNCGMRLSELVGMYWAISTWNSWGTSLRLFGKRHKERMVFLPIRPASSPAVLPGQTQHDGGPESKGKGCICDPPPKERISNRRVEQLVTGAMKVVGLKGFSTDKLRHTAATLMYQTGNVEIDPQAAAGSQQCGYNANLYAFARISGACRH